MELYFVVNKTTSLILVLLSKWNAMLENIKPKEYKLFINKIANRIPITSRFCFFKFRSLTFLLMLR